MSTTNDFEPPSPAYSRSPCPALNALANHGYIARTGKDLAFNEVIDAVHLVYNISYPLAILLTLVGFITCGKTSWRCPSRPLSHPPTLFANFVFFLVTFFIPSWTLELSALSARVPRKIAHDASFVHPDNIPSTAPDPQMVKNLVDYASRIQHTDRNHRSGLSLVDFARYHVQREMAASAKLDSIHKQIALGEVALTWLVLRGSDSQTAYAIVPTESVRQWLGEERLPDGWWAPHGVRPSSAIGLWRARRVANLVQKLAAAGI